MDISESNNGLFDNISNSSNSLKKVIDEISKENPSLSNIPEKNSFSLSSNMTKMAKGFIKSMKSNRCAYPKKNEIPLLKIKNENYFESGKKIEKYFKALSKFEDNIFNICSKCHQKKNNFFCKNCYTNICDICNTKCRAKYHITDNLLSELNKITNYIKIINLIFSKCFILPKKNKNSGEKIKKNKNSKFLDEDEMNEEIEEKPMDYTNDIKLIQAIVDKNYINYFHYKNIEHCFNYLIKKYSINSINDELNFHNDLEYEKSEIDIQEDFEGGNYEDNDYITIRYKINRSEDINIFDYQFVKKYKNICKIIYQNKKLKLREYLKLENPKSNNFLEIKLTGINFIEDASYMFYDCCSLISLPDIFKWNTSKIKNMSYMFYFCFELKSLPDISKWNTNNVQDMSYMFYYCPALKSLPDISKWNTSNVNDMSGMFCNCSSLISLPDLSKWDTNNVKDMNEMFYFCSKLILLPDISKWNINNVTNMSNMFKNCFSLISLPDISEWKTNNVTNMSCMFYNCTSLISLPDLSKWNVNNVEYMNGMFYCCSKLVSLPEWYDINE